MKLKALILSLAVLLLNVPCFADCTDEEAEKIVEHKRLLETKAAIEEQQQIFAKMLTKIDADIAEVKPVKGVVEEGINP